MRITQSFFEYKDTLIITKDLLGKVITKITPEGIISGIINETECYIQTDEATHCYNGITKRNEVMFEKAGHLYVYFTYGMHYCMNIVTEKYGYGGAVLIRSIIPYKGKNLMISNRNWNNKNIKNLVNGPAKVCQAFNITKKDNGINLLNEDSIIFLEDIDYRVPEIKVSKRIGISKAIDKDWRFWF